MASEQPVGQRPSLPAEAPTFRRHSLQTTLSSRPSPLQTPAKLPAVCATPSVTAGPIPPSPRVLTPDEDLADFESDEQPQQRSTPVRPRRPLPADRPSMTRRSCKKQRSRIRPTMQVRTLFDHHSELSSDTDAEPIVARPVSVAKLVSTSAPSPPHTPPQKSPLRNAPRKSMRRRTDPSQSSPSALRETASSTRRRARAISSMFCNNTPDPVVATQHNLASKRVSPDPPLRRFGVVSDDDDDDDEDQPLLQQPRGLPNSHSLSSSSSSSSSAASNPSRKSAPPAKAPPSEQDGSSRTPRKRRRVIVTSSSDSEDGCPDLGNMAPIANLSEAFQASRTRSDNEDEVQIVGDTRRNDKDDDDDVKVVEEDEEQSARRSSLRQRMTRRRPALEVTPSPTPPPSSRKTGRRKRLEEAGSSGDGVDEALFGKGRGRRRELGGGMRRLEEGQEVDKKQGEWFQERTIEEFSCSSGEAEAFRNTPLSVKKRRRSGTSDVRSMIAVDEVELSGIEGLEKEKEDEVEVIMEVSDAEEVGGNGDGDREVVMDVVELGSSDEEKVKKPAPFYVNALCEEGESVEEMVERLGEGYVLERVSAAQEEGRRIMGGQLLGIEEDAVDEAHRFSQFRETVGAGLAGRQGGDGVVASITERALRGEYKFHYRGRDAEQRPRARGWWSRRGRGAGRRGRGARRKQ